MKKSYKLSRKIRQFKYLAKTLNRLIDNSQFQQLSVTKRQKMIAKLRELHDKVRPYLGAAKVRKTVAGAAMLLGVSVGSVNAQFADPAMNPFNLQGFLGINVPNLVDIDGDGDLDLLTTTYDNDTGLANVRFFENVGTAEAPDFSTTPQTNPFNIDLSVIDQEAVFDFDFADMDNDGDMDMLLGSNGYNYSGMLHYYENIGTAEAANFDTPVLNAFGLAITYQSVIPTIVDIDNDGDFDVVVAEYYGDLQYFENTGTEETPIFASPVANPFGLNTGNTSYNTFFDIADIDGDGDVDFLASVLIYSGTVVIYQENTGTPEAPAFEPASADNPLSYVATDDEFFFPEMVDLDNDGDIDVLTNVAYVDNYDSKWEYYENLNIMSATDDLNETVDLQLFPNPVDNLLTVRANFENTVDQLSIEIFDASGRQVFMENSNNHIGELNFQTNTSTYANGLYLLKIQADGQFSTLKFMKE